VTEQPVPLERMIEEHVLAALEWSRGNVAQAARALEISRDRVYGIVRRSPAELQRRVPVRSAVARIARAQRRRLEMVPAQAGTIDPGLPPEERLALKTATLRDGAEDPALAGAIHRAVVARLRAS